MLFRTLMLFFITMSCGVLVKGQIQPDRILDSAIHTVKVHPLNTPEGMPVVLLNEQSPLLFSFDDFKATYQDYYYSVELMNADWTPVALSPFDYLQGFNQNRIVDYSVSSIAIQRYYHYQFTFPNGNCSPKQSGNYVLKVYKNGNVNQVVFTSRFYVVDNQVGVVAAIQEPFDGSISKTHQKVQVVTDVKKIPYFQSNQLKVQVVQNFNFSDAQWATEPSFIRGNSLEYNKEGLFIFPAGKEARWLDLRSLRLVSDRVYKFETKEEKTIAYLKPDISRADQAYYTFNDLNGNYVITNSESLQSENQNDYAKVIFTYMPPQRIPFIGQNLYLQGALTNNILDSNALMRFDGKLGFYQKTLLLKQGYYSYNYVLRDPLETNQEIPISMNDYNETEGNHWETENNYSIFIYYRSPSARHDQIIGFVTVNSKQSW